MAIGVGCIGTGIIVEDIHFPMLTKLKGFKIVGIYDLRKDRSERVAKKFGCKIFSSYKQMLASDEIDVMLVTTPSNTHAQYTIEALKAGKHVVVDKPPATTLADVKKMFAAAKRYKKHLVTFQNRRWDDDFLTVKQVLKKKTLGDVFHIESNIQGYGFGDYGFFKLWRTKKRYGGGQVLDWGPHLIDQLMQIVDSPIVSVWADLRGLLWSKEVDDHCMLMLRFKNGVTAKITATGTMCHPGFRWFVCGLKGVLYKEGPWDSPVLIRTPNSGKKKDAKMPLVKTDWFPFYKQFEKALKGKCDPPVMPEDSIRLMKVIDAARKSAQTGNTVRIRGW